MPELDRINLKNKIDANEDVDDIHFKEDYEKAEVVGYKFIKGEGLTEVLCKIKKKYPIRVDRDERDWEEREEIESFHHMQVCVKRKLVDKYKKEIEGMVDYHLGLGGFEGKQLFEKFADLLEKIQDDYNIQVNYEEIYKNG